MISLFMMFACIEPHPDEVLLPYEWRIQERHCTPLGIADIPAPCDTRALDINICWARYPFLTSIGYYEWTSTLSGLTNTYVCQAAVCDPHDANRLLELACQPNWN